MKAERQRWIAIVFLLVMAVAAFFPDANMSAGSAKLTKDLRGKTVVIPPSAPERDRLVLVSFLDVAFETGITGAVAIYDDPGTEAQTDYVELYNGDGELVSVSWLDPFGILRTAMDSALLAAEPSKLQGLLVLLSDGTHL